MLGALNSGLAGLFATATLDGFDGFLSGAVGGMTLVVVALLFLGLLVGTDIVPHPLEPKAGVVRLTKLARLGVALVHTVLHVAIAVLVLWAAVQIAGDRPLLIWALGIGALFAAGTALGATLFGAVLLAVHRARGERAPEAANQVFTGQSIADYKNLVRMRFGADGSLTVFPLGVDRIGRDWRWQGKDAAGPRFAPGGPAPVVHPIDEPLRFDATGRRQS